MVSAMPRDAGSIRRTHEADDTSTLSCIKAFNEYLFAERGFNGNQERYDDPRNSCLNEVLDRRTGIPITLSLVYMEVGRRAGLRVDGVNFPGHFLVRCPEVGGRGRAGLIVDPFHGGALLSEHDCRVLLEKHVGRRSRSAGRCWRRRPGRRSSCGCCST